MLKFLETFVPAVPGLQVFSKETLRGRKRLVSNLTPDERHAAEHVQAWAGVLRIANAIEVHVLPRGDIRKL